MRRLHEPMSGPQGYLPRRVVPTHRPFPPRLPAAPHPDPPILAVPQGRFRARNRPCGTARERGGGGWGGAPCSGLAARRTCAAFGGTSGAVTAAARALAARCVDEEIHTSSPPFDICRRASVDDDSTYVKHLTILATCPSRSPSSTPPHRCVVSPWEHLVPPPLMTRKPSLLVCERSPTPTVYASSTNWPAAKVTTSPQRIRPRFSALRMQPRTITSSASRPPASSIRAATASESNTRSTWTQCGHCRPCYVCRVAPPAPAANAPQAPSTRASASWQCLRADFGPEIGPEALPGGWGGEGVRG